MPTWKRTTAKTMPTRRPRRSHEHLWIGEAAVIKSLDTTAGGEKEADRFGVNLVREGWPLRAEVLVQHGHRQGPWWWQVGGQAGSAKPTS